MARAEGLTREDLKITAVGGAPARHTLLKDGKIDASGHAANAAQL